MLSQGMKLFYKKGEAEFVELTNLQEVPDLGGDAEAVEITTLTDVAHMYEDGLLNYGDTVAFKFLYEKEQFTALDDMKEKVTWKVQLPDETACTFDGTGRVKLNGVGINSPLTYTLGIKPATEMKWA